MIASIPDLPEVRSKCVFRLLLFVFFVSNIYIFVSWFEVLSFFVAGLAHAFCTSSNSAAAAAAAAAAGSGAAAFGR